MSLDRRAFIKSSLLASTAPLVPGFLKAYAPLLKAGGHKVLVVVQLGGGNDGLNTVIPFRNDLYYENRDMLAYNKSQTFEITDELGLNPRLEGINDLYQQGYVGILNNVGYPNPNRSHFRSRDIWQSASDSDKVISTGWLGRYLDNTCTGSACSVNAVEVGLSMSLAMKGERIKALTIKNPRQLYLNSKDDYFKALAKADLDKGNETLSYLYKTMVETVESADYIYEKSKVFKSTTEYPNSNFGSDLKTIAELIICEVDTKVYYVTLNGFDTHANQKRRHESLLDEYSKGISALMQDLIEHNKVDDVLVTTFSEFGRRLAENGAAGTDHGAANNVFLMGGGLKQKGVINELPNLNALFEGDVVHTVDFRQVYKTILENWLSVDSSKIITGNFDTLGFV